MILKRALLIDLAALLGFLILSAVLLATMTLSSVRQRRSEVFKD